MSYCRWSSDDWACDVYVYADVKGGWTTHVAGNRIVFPRPLPPPVSLPNPPDEESVRAWFERHQAVMAMIDESKRVPIGLQWDGATFNDETAADCADRLASLRQAGYRVPQYAIDALREEEG